MKIGCELTEKSAKFIHHGWCESDYSKNLMTRVDVRIIFFQFQPDDNFERNVCNEHFVKIILYFKNKKLINN